MTAPQTVDPPLHAPDTVFSASTVVLVEGVSDQRAVEALARLRGRDLATERVAVVAMGGAQAIGRHLNELGPSGLDLRLAGLCDAGEERDFARALERAGLGSSLTRTDMTATAGEVADDELEELVAVFARRSVEHGGGPFTAADVRAPAPLRLYRAAASEQWILDSGDNRVPVTL